MFDFRDSEKDFFNIDQTAFATYAIRWIIFALTGYDVLFNKSTSSQGIGIDCELKIPLQNNKFMSLSVKDNIVYLRKL